MCSRSSGAEVMATQGSGEWGQCSGRGAVGTWTAECTRAPAPMHGSRGIGVMLLLYGGGGWAGAWSSRAGELSSMGVRALQVEGSWGEALGATSTISAAIEWFSGEWQATFQGGERKWQQDAGARNVVTRSFTRTGMVVVHNIWTILNHRLFLNVCVWKKN